MAVSVSGWVFEENVRQLCEYVAVYTGTRWSDADDDALERGLPGTDGERGDMWDYEVGLTPRVVLSLGHDVGTSVVLVRIAGELTEVLAARFDTLIDLL